MYYVGRLVWPSLCNTNASWITYSHRFIYMARQLKYLYSVYSSRLSRLHVSLKNVFFSYFYNGLLNLKTLREFQIKLIWNQSCSGRKRTKTHRMTIYILYKAKYCGKKKDRKSNLNKWRKKKNSKRWVCLSRERHFYLLISRMNIRNSHSSNGPKLILFFSHSHPHSCRLIQLRNACEKKQHCTLFSFLVLFFFLLQMHVQHSPDWFFDFYFAGIILHVSFAVYNLKWHFSLPLTLCWRWNDFFFLLLLWIHFLQQTQLWPINILVVSITSQESNIILPNFTWTMFYI